MSVKVQGTIVIDDSRNLTNVANVSTTAVQIYANGVIANVQMSVSPANNDVVNYGFTATMKPPTYTAF